MLLLLACSQPVLDSAPPESQALRPREGQYAAQEFETEGHCGAIEAFVPLDTTYELRDSELFFELAGFDWSSSCVGLDPYSCADVAMLEFVEPEVLELRADFQLSGRVLGEERLRLDRLLVVECEGVECEAFLGDPELGFPCTQRNSFELRWRD